MHESSCSFTGHRRIPQDDFLNLQKRLQKIIKQLIKQGITTFYCGGALGFDTLAAQAVLKTRRFQPQVKLILASPAAIRRNNGGKRTGCSMNPSNGGRMRWYIFPSVTRGDACSSGTATWSITATFAFATAQTVKAARHIR